MLDPVTIQCSSFSISNALDCWAADQHNDFGSSPLTTPESTPPPSPQLPAASLCEHSPLDIPPLVPQLTKDCQAESEGPDCASSNVQRKRFKTDNRRKQQYAAYRAARSKKRKAEKSARYQLNERGRDVYAGSAQHIQAMTDVSDQPAARTGYTGVRERTKSRKVHRLEELVGPKSKLGFKYIKWDGRSPMIITDAQNRLCLICAGRPNGINWESLQSEAIEAMESARRSCTTPASHRRGRFSAIATGVSHGGGQTRPSNFKGEGSGGAMEALNSTKAFQRLSGFASSVLATWAPKLCQHYYEMKDKLFKKTSNISQVFPASPFCAATYNVGPRTCCCRHKDHQNLPYGLCAVTSLGSFDYTNGGHLVLWELEIVIEFPAGSTILLPSALITHSNTAIGQDESRYSFTQYTAGGLFRWVDNGCMKQDDYLASLTTDQLKSWQAQSESRMARGLSLLPVVPCQGRERPV